MKVTLAMTVEQAQLLADKMTETRSFYYGGPAEVDDLAARLRAISDRLTWLDANVRDLQIIARTLAALQSKNGELDRLWIPSALKRVVDSLSRVDVVTLLASAYKDRLIEF